MTKKKNKKTAEVPEQSEVESAEVNLSETDSTSDEVEAVVSESNPMDRSEEDQIEQKDESDESLPSDEDELSSEDLLDDVRRSLIEENAHTEEEKKPRWWQRFSVGKKNPQEETPPVVEHPQTMDSMDVDPIVETEESSDESIDELIGMLETQEETDLESELETASEVVHVEQEQLQPVAEPEPVDVEELKKRIFQARKPDDNEENFSDVRSVALEGGEEVFVEVEVKTEDPMEDRLKSFENALRPYRRYIYFGIAFIGVVVIIITSALLYDAYKQTLPPEPVQEVDNLPYPVTLNIPGGLSFSLGRGNLENGRWNPVRPEWLVGTNICRWVSIPYSRQLEAVIRTLTRDDQLELVMSNDDRWSYDVYSITQMSIEDMQAESSNSACLLLVLADVNTDTRWVVTAYP